MRLDKWLKVSRLIKRRTVANEACDNARVSANGRPVKASYDVKPGDVLVLGLCLVPAKDSSAGFWYLNPGSVSIPKEGSAHGYMTLEGDAFRWKDLSGREYDSLTL